MTTRHSYPKKSIFRQYALSITGILVSLIAIFWFSPIFLINFIFIGFIGLCMVAAWRSLLRQRALVMCDEYSLIVRDVGQVKLEWHKLQKIRLVFYALRSDHRDGWLRLKLKDGQRTIVIDSQISQFYTIAERAARAAYDNGLVLDRLSKINFKVLGLAYPGWEVHDHNFFHPATTSRSQSPLYRKPRKRLLRSWPGVDKFHS